MLAFWFLQWLPLPRMPTKNLHFDSTTRKKSVRKYVFIYKLSVLFSLGWVLSTPALALDKGNSSFLSAINWSWHCRNVFISGRTCLWRAHMALESISWCFQLFICKICKLIDTEFVRFAGLTVKSIYACNIFLQNVVTCGLLSIVSVYMPLIH